MPSPPTVTIAGTNRTAYVRRAQKINIRYTLGAVGRLQCETLDKGRTTATAYRPTPDQTIALSADGVTLFSGTILSVGDDVLGQPNIGVVTAVTAADLQRAALRRLVTATYAAGSTVKSIVSSIRTTYLASFGITLDAGMLDGPTLETAVEVEEVTVEGVFNHLSDMTGLIWRITPAGVLEFFTAGSKTAAFTLSTANANIRGGPRWTKTRGKYVNRLYVRAGTATQVEKTKLITGNGTTALWVLDYPLVVNNGIAATRGYITEGSNNLPLGVYGLDSTAWTIEPSTGTLRRTTAPGSGVAISFIYTAQFPITVVAEDAAEIAANGIWEDVVKAEDVFDKDTAVALAEALVRRYKGIPRTLTIKTRAGFELPGTTVTVTVPERTLSGSWLITGVTIRDEVDQGFLYEYECLEGVEAQASWVEFWRTAVGTGTASQSMGTVSGGLLPALSGSFTSPVTAWSSSSSKQVRLDQMTGYGVGQGPGIQYGLEDGTHSWRTYANQLSSSSRRNFRIANIGTDHAEEQTYFRVAEFTSATSVLGLYPGEWWFRGPGSGGVLHLGDDGSVGDVASTRIGMLAGRVIDLVGAFGSGGSSYVPIVDKDSIKVSATAPSRWAANLTGNSGSGVSFGVAVNAGSTSADSAFHVQNYAQSSTLQRIRGDGVVLFGTTVGTGAGAGNLVMPNSADLRGVNNAGTNTVQMLRLNTSDEVVLSPGGNDIKIGRALVALGGGAAPTLGTIGGSGPATAAQNTWMRFIDSGGAACWVPVWK